MSIDRSKWPADIPQGASGRDAFLAYIVQGWPLFFGGAEPVEPVFDHDFGIHVLRRGTWELRLVDTASFPDEAFRLTDEPT